MEVVEEGMERQGLVSWVWASREARRGERRLRRGAGTATSSCSWLRRVQEEGCRRRYCRCCCREGKSILLWD
jgi:hypothetical protein